MRSAVDLHDEMNPGGPDGLPASRSSALPALPIAGSVTAWPGEVIGLTERPVPTYVDPAPDPEPTVEWAVDVAEPAPTGDRGTAGGWPVGPDAVEVGGWPAALAGEPTELTGPTEPAGPAGPAVAPATAGVELEAPDAQATVDPDADGHDVAADDKVLAARAAARAHNLALLGDEAVVRDDLMFWATEADVPVQGGGGGWRRSMLITLLALTLLAAAAAVYATQVAGMSLDDIRLGASRSPDGGASSAPAGDRGSPREPNRAPAVGSQPGSPDPTAATESGGTATSGFGGAVPGVVPGDASQAPGQPGAGGESDPGGGPATGGAGGGVGNPEPPPDADPEPSPVTRRGSFTVSVALGSDEVYDFDSGLHAPADTYAGQSKPDLTGGPLGINALNGAEFATWTGKNAPSRANCNTIAKRAWTKAVLVETLVPGAHVCVRTSDGKLGVATVKETTKLSADGFTAQLRWLVWQ